MVRKKSDEPIIQKLSKKADEDFLPFGVLELDKAIGGIPRGRITELWGEEKIGKSHTLGQIMAGNTDKKILLIDTEFAVNKARIESFGANLDSVDFVQDARLERVSELIIASVGKYDLILLDSLAQLTPLTVENQEVGENAIGLFSRLIKQFATKLRPRLGASKTALVVVNQWRVPFGMFAKPTPIGGESWKHNVDVRIRLESNANDKVREEGAQVAHWVRFQVVKSKVSQPYVTGKYKVEY